VKAGYYTTWPELTASRIDKYLVKLGATIKGHLDQQRKHTQSTKPKAKPKATKPFKFPGAGESIGEQQPVAPEERCNHVFLTCTEITGQIYSDQPGQFLCRSSSGMAYIMVAHDYDSNAILVEAMPSRTSASMRMAYKEIHRILTSRGFRPQYQRLDNEISKEFKVFSRRNQGRLPTDSSRQPSSQRGRTGHPHMKEPLHLHPMQY
jgi:hypothetical protein